MSAPAPSDLQGQDHRAGGDDDCGVGCEAHDDERATPLALSAGMTCQEGRDRECDGLGERDDGVGDTLAQLVAIGSDEARRRRRGVIEREWVDRPVVPNTNGYRRPQFRTEGTHSAAFGSARGTRPHSFCADDLGRGSQILICHCCDDLIMLRRDPLPHRRWRRLDQPRRVPPH